MKKITDPEIKKFIAGLTEEIKSVPPRARIVPKHWWQWLTPRFWKFKKYMEGLVNNPEFVAEIADMTKKSMITGKLATEKEMEASFKRISKKIPGFGKEKSK